MRKVGKHFRIFSQRRRQCASLFSFLKPFQCSFHVVTVAASIQSHYVRELGRHICRCIHARLSKF